MKREEFIVDRIEGNSIVLEDNYQGIIVIDINSIEGEAKEGYVIIKENDLFKVDIKATIERKDRINALMKGMWED